MMKLYEFSVSRSIRCRWLLEELGVPYESVEVNLSTGAHFSENFKKINPNAKVPALVDGDFALFESAAICNYLAEKYPESNFIPKAGTRARALYDQWMFFCMSELEQPLWLISKHTFIYPEEKRSPEAIQLAKEDFLKTVRVLENHMANRSYVGDSFQVVDILIGQTLLWAGAGVGPVMRSLALLAGCPNLHKYLYHLAERPKMPLELKERANSLKNPPTSNVN